MYLPVPLPKPVNLKFCKNPDIIENNMWYNIKYYILKFSGKNTQDIPNEVIGMYAMEGFYMISNIRELYSCDTKCETHSSWVITSIDTLISH